MPRLFPHSQPLSSGSIQRPRRDFACLASARPVHRVADSATRMEITRESAMQSVGAHRTTLWIRKMPIRILRSVNTVCRADQAERDSTVSCLRMCWPSCTIVPLRGSRPSERQPRENTRFSDTVRTPRPRRLSNVLSSSGNCQANCNRSDGSVLAWQFLNQEGYAYSAAAPRIPS